MNRIKQLREEKGWTQAKLGKLLNVQKAAVSKYELGKIPITDSTIMKLVEIFDETSDYILGITDVRNKKNDANAQSQSFIEEGLTQENIEELKKFAELLKLKQKVEQNDEISSSKLSI